MTALRKITVIVPADVLARASKATGDGVTGTVRRALELLAASSTYDALRRRRGKVKLDLDLAKLREDG